jgi:O-antigen ligase
MAHGDLAQLAAVVGAAGTVLVLLARHRHLLIAGIALLGVAEGSLVAALVPSQDLERLQTALGAAAVVVGVAAIGVLSVVFARRPELATPALLLAAPFRIPIELGNQKAFLLVPLYGVVAATSLGFVYRWLHGEPIRSLPRQLAAPATALVALYALSLLWSEDLRQGSIQLVFFLFPFVAGVAVVARAPLPSWLPRTLGVILVGLAAVFATIGIWQAATHTIFFAQDLRVANAYTSFFRVTSVFKDPSLYGRYLVLGFAVIAVALWLNRIWPPLAVALSALLFAGLWFSYSQSSMVALAVVVIAVTLAAADGTARVIVAATASVALVVAAIAVTLYAIDHSSDRVTSGRTRLVSSTARVIEAHPLIGVGIGAQPRASREVTNGRGLGWRGASHTTPLTVAAELGVVGLLLYLALLAGAARVLWETWLRDRALGLGLAAVFLTLFVHSLFYAGFFEDPVTWGSLAIAAAVVTAVARPAPVEELAARERTASATKVAAPAR